MTIAKARRWHGRKGTVYLLHFSSPLHHARHYLGWTADLEERLEKHRSGRGSRMVAAVIAAGGSFVVARTWVGDLFDERVLHRQRNAPRLCPICKGSAAQRGLPCAVDMATGSLVATEE